MPNGMTLEKEEELRTAGNLFQEPDSTLLLSSGCGRHWPDARGIYHNNDANLFVWVNEEDHCRIISMDNSKENGGNVKSVFERFCNISKSLSKVAEEQVTICRRFWIEPATAPLNFNGDSALAN